MDSNSYPIWEGAGSYIPAAKTTSSNMFNDASCFLETAAALIDTIIDGLEEEEGTLAANPRQVATALHGVRYLTELGRGMAAAGHSAILKVPSRGAPGHSIGPILADACALAPSDREVVERFLRATRTAGVVLEPESFRSSPDATLRDMWGGGQ